MLINFHYLDIVFLKIFFYLKKSHNFVLKIRLALRKKTWFLKWSTHKSNKFYIDFSSIFLCHILVILFQYTDATRWGVSTQWFVTFPNCFSSVVMYTIYSLIHSTREIVFNLIYLINKIIKEIDFLITKAYFRTSNLELF